MGSGALLALVLTLARPLTPIEAFAHAGLLALGGLWYFLLALAVQQVRPYWPAQQALGECLHAIARFLEIKATFYDPHTKLDDDYRHLVAQQVVVNEKQEAVRDLLFRTRQIVNETTVMGRRLVLAFTEAVDLYEHITATYFDYAALRKDFGETGLLADVAAHIRHIAAELDHLGATVQVGRPYASGPDLLAELSHLQARIAELDQQDAPNAYSPNHSVTPPLSHSPSTRVLKKILVNLRDVTRRLGGIRRAFAESELPAPAPSRAAEHRQFVSPQELEWRAFGQNLTRQSGVFRHSIRMMLACLVAFIVAESLWRGSHSYWILMTVTFMLKPSFSLTRERNIARVAGTLAGGALGVVVLTLLPEPKLRLALLAVFMVGAYSFQRTYYWATVVFTTAYLLIMFSFLGLGYRGVIEERVIDTLMGCAIALAAAYLLFPNWESEQLTDLMAAALRANQAYLRQLADRLAGREVSGVKYRLLRKDVYVATANLAAAFQRMLSEPRSKHRHPRHTHEFVVLNHILSSNIAALTATVAAQPAPVIPPPAEVRRALLSTQAALGRSLARFGTPLDGILTEPIPDATVPKASPEAPAASRSLLEQLAFLQKVSSDISRVTEVVAG